MNSRLLDSKPLRLAHVRKINGGDAWKVENGTLHFDPTAKENNQRFSSIKSIPIFI
jgi:hypothetical protein